MRRSTVLMSLLLVVGLVATAAAAGGATRCVGGHGSSDAGLAEGEITIQVSPHVIVLESVSECVTVHADIAFSEVDVATVALNGIPTTGCKADNRGDLVAKFDPIAVKSIIAPPEALFTLTGQTLAGVAFSGSETIRVK
jgi:hypothetical protein